MKKLDDLPKKPHSQEDVMKAMTELHKLVMKQAAAYGGKKSKYIPAHVLEGSLLKQVQDVLVESEDEASRLLDLAHDSLEDLIDHLGDDSKAIGKLTKVLKYIGLALGEIEK